MRKLRAAALTALAGCFAFAGLLALLAGYARVGGMLLLFGGGGVLLFPLEYRSAASASSAMSPSFLLSLLSLSAACVLTAGFWADRDEILRMGAAWIMAGLLGASALQLLRLHLRRWRSTRTRADR